MEAKDQNSTQISTALTVVVPSQKKQIDSIESQLAKNLAQAQDNIEQVVSIKIEGNSYSKQFCQTFGTILKKAKNIKDLNINDIFVARGKLEIPESILAISHGLQGSGLLRLDISNNAVNVYGAENLLHYLKQASTLQVLLISNCGLGPLGVAHIAEGLKGTPKLRTFSIGRNRMENPGIQSISNSLQYVPLLQELYVYQNTLKEEGLRELFKNLRVHCKNIASLDINDNFVRKTATTELSLLLKENLSLENINLSDCLQATQNEEIVTAFQKSTNRLWERIGFNYAELSEDQAKRLLKVLKECPLKKLDIIGNEFEEDLQEQFTNAFQAGVISNFEDEEEEEVTRLFQELKI